MVCGHGLCAPWVECGHVCLVCVHSLCVARLRVVALCLQDNDIHAAVLTLGLKFADWMIVGANKRTSAMLKAFCQVITDFQAPDMHSAADLSRNLDARLKPLISYIVACRPISIGMGNAIRSRLSPSAAGCLLASYASCWPVSSRRVRLPCLRACLVLCRRVPPLRGGV